jgi:hypothetical protein
MYIRRAIRESSMAEVPPPGTKKWLVFFMNGQPRYYLSTKDATSREVRAAFRVKDRKLSITHLEVV